MTLFNALILLVNRDEEGQGLAEYALILALIAIVAIIALIFLGSQVSCDPGTVELGLVRPFRTMDRGRRTFRPGPHVPAAGRRLAIAFGVAVGIGGRSTAGPRGRRGSTES
jgi:Flp pilus assembly pilin Flp